MAIYAPYQGTYLNEEFVGYERAKKYIKDWDVWENASQPMSFFGL